jgi:hypothetical protein
MRFLGIARQRVGTFVGRAERARTALLGEVFAECLTGAALGAGGNRLGELELIFARHLMHPGLLERGPFLVAFYACVAAGASVRKRAASRRPTLAQDMHSSREGRRKAENPANASESTCG